MTEQDEAVRLRAEILRMTGCCEKGHRKGTPHFHEETVHRWGQRLAAFATPPPAAPALDVERLRQALFTEFRRSFWGREEGWAQQVSRIVADNVAPEYARLTDQEDGDG